jgi:hypothetical protein
MAEDGGSSCRRTKFRCGYFFWPDIPWISPALNANPFESELLNRRPEKLIAAATKSRKDLESILAFWMNGRTRLLHEDLLRLSRKACYWVVLEVTMFIFQSSPTRISIEE